MTNSVYLVRLDWPERCFCARGREIAVLRSLVPAGSRIVCARGEAEFLRSLPFATHAIVWEFRKEWFALAPRLKVLATPGAGRELVAWRDAPPGTRVHFGGFHGKIISGTVEAFVLAWAHGFFHPALSRLRPGGGGAESWAAAWPRARLGGIRGSVAGTKAAIAGYGKIGKSIGERLSALGVEVRGLTRKNIDGFAGAVRNADWLVLALPGDTGTDGFLSRGRIALLPEKCVVVNVGRGNAVDEEALLEALRGGRIAGAYLDVFRGEPGPLAGAYRGGGKDGAGAILGTAARDLPPNLVVTPHSSAFAADYLEMCFKELSDDGCL